nr:hypothetical protein [Tanacetum cinerariifolium]
VAQSRGCVRHRGQAWHRSYARRAGACADRGDGRDGRGDHARDHAAVDEPDQQYLNFRKRKRL